jgi:membrane-bound lytic murein transglycosylase B
MKEHHRVLQAVSKKYGIPASIIVAIIGVETEYGAHLGKYSVLNSLYTLGFYYPPREKFFRKELAQYLILTRDNHLPVSSIKGSYAGALGIPQFMPSSYRHYGVALEKNAPVNLFNNNDAIASVANYFHKMGWAPNQPITHQLYSKNDSIRTKTMNLITLPVKRGAEYWATYKNFKVIMSYNHNIVYAMAVYQLSKKIEQQYAADNREAKGRTISS